MNPKTLTNEQIHELREMNKIGLETYTFDKYNILDHPISSFINDLKTRLEDNYKEHQEWIDMPHTYPQKYEAMIEMADQYGYSLEAQNYDCIRNAWFIEEELYVLHEMKIIYAFKHLEINIKRLLAISYSGISTREFYKWEFLIKFLNTKGISSSELEGFDEVMQLKQVNNHLKHNYNFNSDSFRHIPELKEKKELNHYDLELFYNRVKSYPEKFLSAVVSAVHKDLYQYNTDKIDMIAQNIAIQMDKETAEKLAQSLLQKYS